MAGAMVEGWRRAGANFTGVTVIRPSGKEVAGIRTLASYPDAETPRFVMLGFKPQKLDEIAPYLARRCGPETIIVSILAGAEVASLRARFPAVRSVVRAMPNLPVAIGKGVVAVHGDGDAVDDVAGLMQPLGLVIATAAERELAGIGAIAGAGPAYVARFAEALAAAGKAHGVAGDALGVALTTIEGTAALMRSTGERGDELARRVASPRGTTEAGLAVLDDSEALDRLIERTIAAAVARGRELAAEAAIDRPNPTA
jgi:pyrroline-5-carboxylate reductase